jgi:hypothetical protein
MIPRHGRASLIIAAGFLLRAFAGQALFWISYLRLPIARPLQLGDGLWFFAVDGAFYVQYAQHPANILANARYPSHVFVQVFTLFCTLFGAIASTAILMNCAAYLATCALILRIADRHAGRSRGIWAAAGAPHAHPGPSTTLGMTGNFTLAAIAFGPAMLLWSTQPLKDTFFFLLIVALIALAAWWAERQSIAIAIGMMIVMYAIAGTRWYFAAIALGALLIFFAMTAPKRSILLFLALGIAFRFGGSTDIPPLFAKNYPASMRAGFENTPGATAIKAGPAAPTQTVAGAAATFVPRSVAQEANLVRIGGGRGFWLLADLDTVVFSAVIAIAIALCVRAIRGGARVTPLFVFVALLFVITAAPMIYTVTNFGTLFRLRQMLYLLAALAPITLDRPAPAR